MSRIENRGPAAGQTQGAGGVMETVTERAGEWASAVASRAEDAWEATRDEARELASAAAGRAEDFATTATRLLRRYPIPSLLALFGTGVLLGVALRRLTSPSLRDDSWEI